MSKFWIGIDVSKKTLDAALLVASGGVLAQKKIDNTAKALQTLYRRWARDFGFTPQECLVCLEPTGHYSNLPVLTLLDMEAPTWLAHPSDIIKGTGTTRGKDDKVDALRIAVYARR